jgi:hypothetical protein
MLETLVEPEKVMDLFDEATNLVTNDIKLFSFVTDAAVI